MVTLESIITNIKEYSPDADVGLIKRAHDFASRKHRGQTRVSGKTFITHPLEVAQILTELRLDIVTIAGGMLHDTLEDTKASIEDLREEFSDEIAELVEGVTKIGLLTFRSDFEKQAENFRKMIVAISRDIRVLLIKLADRLHNVRTLQFLPEEKQLRIASETLEIYAPLAHRMGIHWIKAELEDRAFRYLHREAYCQLAEKVARSEKERNKFREQIIAIIRKDLDKYKIQGEVTGRPKHFYSIYSKMTSQKIEFEQVYDIMGFRVIVETVQECYEALGVMHSVWKPVPGRFKDYIAMPKANFYQSLHTALIGPHGERIEVQIRTKLMHQIADRGIAAHWKYKEGYLRQKTKDDAKFSWLAQLIEDHQGVSDPKEFLQSVKLDLFAEKIYVFTPKGEVKEFPRGATPIDFAFAIHTQVGYHCLGAKVDGRLVPLRYKLRSGDSVEIMTSQNAKPTKDWLSFVKTSRARTKIKHTIVREEREDARLAGKQLCENTLKKRKIRLSHEIKSGKMLEVAKSFRLKGVDELFLHLGYGKIEPNDIVARFVPENSAPPEETGKKKDLEDFIQKFTPRESASDIITVAGIPNILIKFAKCCNPLPGETIVGFITRGRGVTIHTEDCPKIVNADSERQVEAKWNVSESRETTVQISVLAIDNAGILHDITSVIAEHDVNISSLNIETTRDKKAICTFGLNTYSITHLNKVINGIEAISGVISVKRNRS